MYLASLRIPDDDVRELPNLPLEDALRLVRSPKTEPAARRWLVRYLSEGTPSLRDTHQPPSGRLVLLPWTVAAISGRAV